jgi:hypothetical protein
VPRLRAWSASKCSFEEEPGHEFGALHLSLLMRGPLGNDPDPIAYGKADNKATTAKGKAPYFISNGTKTQGTGCVYGVSSNGLGPNLNANYSNSNARL